MQRYDPHTLDVSFFNLQVDWLLQSRDEHEIESVSIQESQIQKWMNKKFGIGSIIDRDLILTTHPYCKVTIFKHFILLMLKIKIIKEF